MAKLNLAQALQLTIGELTKEGNKVAKTKVLPPGRNADKGFDVASFNAGMRYAMQRISTAAKQHAEGRFQPPETAKKAPVKKSAAPAKAAKAAPAKKAVRQVVKQPATVTSINSARKVVSRKQASA